MNNNNQNNSFDYDLVINKSQQVKPSADSTESIKLTLKLNFNGVSHAEVCEHAAQKLAINHAAKVRKNWRHYVDLEDKTIELMVKDDFGQTGGTREPTFADLIKFVENATPEQKAQIKAAYDDIHSK